MTTERMKRYYKYLVKLCNENGINPVDAESKTSYGLAINRMKKSLIAAGVNANEPKPKYRFDKDGNIIEIATGKIYKRRGGKGKNND